MWVWLGQEKKMGEKWDEVVLDTKKNMPTIVAFK
jgi:hypothetical protein